MRFAPIQIGESHRRRLAQSSRAERTLGTCLHAPIEMQLHKNTSITGVPSGRTNKEIACDLDYHVFTPDAPDAFDEDVKCDMPDEDERFVSMFTLSRFRKDLMLHAIGDFPEECALKTTSLGAKCKLFCQKQWNSSSWTEMNNTQVFHSILKDHMPSKSRVKDGKLSIRLSFGRAKRGWSLKAWTNSIATLTKTMARLYSFHNKKRNLHLP